MANQKILLKRSATQYKIPTTAQLALGELGLNTHDGKLFIEKEVSGTASVVELGVGPTFQLSTGGSPTHTHSVSITGQQALDLLNGTATTVTVRSSDAGHTHDITVKYDTTSKGFVLNNSSSISSNHAVAHTFVSNGGGASSMDTLSDVDTTGVANGKILKYNSTTSKWSIADDSTGTTINYLKDVGDVSTTAATASQVLTWDTGTSKWAPADNEGGTQHTSGTTAPSSPNLGDEFFDTGTDILYKWVNDGTVSAWLDVSTDSVLSIANLSDISDVDSTAPSAGQVLKWNASSSKWAPSSDEAGILQDIATVTVGTSIATVDSWVAATYTSAKYTVTCKVGTKFSTSELLVLNKGGVSVELTEYATLGDNIITLTVDISGTDVRLRAISTDASTSVKLTKILQGV